MTRIVSKKNFIYSIALYDPWAINFDGSNIGLLPFVLNNDVRAHKLPEFCLHQGQFFLIVIFEIRDQRSGWSERFSLVLLLGFVCILSLPACHFLPTSHLFYIYRRYNESLFCDCFLLPFVSPKRFFLCSRILHGKQGNNGLV